MWGSDGQCVRPAEGAVLGVLVLYATHLIPQTQQTALLLSLLGSSIAAATLAAPAQSRTLSPTTSYSLHPQPSASSALGWLLLVAARVVQADATSSPSRLLTFPHLLTTTVPPPLHHHPPPHHSLLYSGAGGRGGALASGAGFGGRSDERRAAPDRSLRRLGARPGHSDDGGGLRGGTAPLLRRRCVRLTLHAPWLVRGRRTTPSRRRCAALPSTRGRCGLDPNPNPSLTLTLTLTLT